MEFPKVENQTDEASRLRISSSTSSNQLFIADTLDLPDDTFRMSLDNYSVIGENVTIGERGSSIESGPVCLAAETPASTPVVETPGSLVIETPESPVERPETPIVDTPETPIVQPFTPPADTSPPILDTPKTKENLLLQDKAKRPQNLLKLSFLKNNDDVFVKPSPVDIMSPARMLQFEVDACATPTMKRAVIDFDFFKQNNYEEYFKGDSKDEDSEEKTLEENDEQRKEDREGEKTSDNRTAKSFEETPVIVKADTVRLEIGYGDSFSQQ
ncbi:hypothetical protein MSG28_015600 [Choristoneura fumiferana]|uniref:Uncharacterized protein n=1 Tax=Choristoneura fumiferana TaxID=7141 RepID=A0ACC0KAR8_CHOFU|nr:hypothetical protein MSG28_015600 [Choristoneura fumiferana]